MGYTHYWTQKRNFTVKDWHTIRADISAILDTARAGGLAIGDASGERIASNADLFFTEQGVGACFMFNGLGKEEHYETFSVYQKRPPLEAWQGKESRGRGFCKTERRPYDSAVTAILIYLESVYPDTYAAGSDGTPEDWRRGLAIARRALPRLGNVLRIPAEVEFDAQFCNYLLQGNQYFIGERIDGAICIGTQKMHILAVFPAGPVAEDAKRRMSAVVARIPRAGYVNELTRKRDSAARTILQAAPMWGGMLIATA